VRKLGVLALGAILMSATTVAAPAYADGPGGSCGYHAGQYGTNTIDINRGGLDVVTSKEVTSMVWYAQATGMNTGDKVLVYSNDNGVRLGFTAETPGAPGSGTLSFRFPLLVEVGDGTTGPSGSSPRLSGGTANGLTAAQGGATGLYTFEITRGGVQVGKFTCAVLGD
jgi:hypothetical protein